jgi:replication factor C subunit 2/4
MPKKSNKLDFIDDFNFDKPEVTQVAIKSKPTQSINIPWIEKYRPIKIEDLVIDDDIRNRINKFNNDKEMPNIIITGVPGIGKTTTILCIAKCLLGRYFKQGVLELNASDDRGIKSVNDSITYFCKKKMDIDDTNRQYSKHKIILLDEADNMTKKAQQLVNNLMKQYKHTTRFAFTCNNSSDIIEAIQSSCIILRYKRLNDPEMLKRLQNICEQEQITYNDEGLKSIVLTSQGDMRKAINHLQLTYNGYGDINPVNVYKLCDKPHPIVIKDIFIACHNKNLKTALILLDKLREKGYSSSDISLSMFNTLKVLEINEIDEMTKIKYMTEISKTSQIITKGVNTSLQLTGCIAELCT